MFVYLMQSLENGYYKIGISKNPNTRLKQLQTGNSSKIKIIETFESDLARNIETTLHNRYSHIKKNGEWFDLALEDEVRFVKNCKGIEELHIYLKSQGNVFI